MPLPKPSEKAALQRVFPCVCVSCQYIFVFSVLKMDERGRAQQISFWCRKAKVPMMFLLFQVLSQSLNSSADEAALSGCS